MTEAVTHKLVKKDVPQVWAFAGGKGGVGKSLVCASVAVDLARRNLRVVAVDADLGAANLHTLLGLLRPSRNVGEYFQSPSVPLDSLCLQTRVDNVKILSGASAILQAANPDFRSRQRFVRDLLKLDADIILIDLGAGSHYPTLDLFAVAGQRLVITSPEPTSIQNTYGFLKAATFRRLELAHGQDPQFAQLLARAVRTAGPDRIESVAEMLEYATDLSPSLADNLRELVEMGRPRLVINQSGLGDEKRVYGALAIVCNRYLGFKPLHVGTLPDDPSVRVAVRRMRPVLVDAPDSPFAQCLHQFVDELMTHAEQPQPGLLLDAAHGIGHGTQLTSLSDKVAAAESAKPASAKAASRRPNTLADVLADVGPEARQSRSDAHDSEVSGPPKLETEWVPEPSTEANGVSSATETQVPEPSFNETVDQGEQGSLLASSPVSNRPINQTMTDPGDLNLDSFDGALDRPTLDEFSSETTLESEVEVDTEIPGADITPDLIEEVVGEEANDSVPSETESPHWEDIVQDDAGLSESPLPNHEVDPVDDHVSETVEPLNVKNTQEHLPKPNVVENSPSTSEDEDQASANANGSPSEFDEAARVLDDDSGQIPAPENEGATDLIDVDEYGDGVAEGVEPEVLDDEGAALSDSSAIEMQPLNESNEDRISTPDLETEDGDASPDPTSRLDVDDVTHNQEPAALEIDTSDAHEDVLVAESSIAEEAPVDGQGSEKNVIVPDSGDVSVSDPEHPDAEAIHQGEENTQQSAVHSEIVSEVDDPVESSDAAHDASPLDGQNSMVGDLEAEKPTVDDVVGVEMGEPDLGTKGSGQMLEHSASSGAAEHEVTNTDEILIPKPDLAEDFEIDDAVEGDVANGIHESEPDATPQESRGKNGLDDPSMDEIVEDESPLEGMVQLEPELTTEDQEQAPELSQMVKENVDGDVSNNTAEPVWDVGHSQDESSDTPGDAENMVSEAGAQESGQSTRTLERIQEPELDAQASIQEEHAPAMLPSGAAPGGEVNAAELDDLDVSSLEASPGKDEPVTPPSGNSITAANGQDDAIEGQLDIAQKTDVPPDSLSEVKAVAAEPASLGDSTPAPVLNQPQGEAPDVQARAVELSEPLVEEQTPDGVFDRVTDSPETIEGVSDSESLFEEATVLAENALSDEGFLEPSDEAPMTEDIFGTFDGEIEDDELDALDELADLSDFGEEDGFLIHRDSGDADEMSTPMAKGGLITSPRQKPSDQSTSDKNVGGLPSDIALPDIYGDDDIFDDDSEDESIMLLEPHAVENIDESEDWDELFEDGVIGEAIAEPDDAEQPIVQTRHNESRAETKDLEWLGDEEDAPGQALLRSIEASEVVPVVDEALSLAHSSINEISLDAQLLVLDQELADLETELTGQRPETAASPVHPPLWKAGQKRTIPPVSIKHPKRAVTMGPSIAKPARAIGFSPAMQMALSMATKKPSVSQLPVEHEPLDSAHESWDGDPWTQVELIDEASITILGNVEDFTEASDKPDELIPEDDGRRTGPAMADPPSHSVITLDEVIECAAGLFHVSTQDCAPNRPVILTRVFVDGQLARETESSYGDLVAADGSVIDVALIPMRVESMHNEVKTRLRSGGLDALDGDE